MSRMLAALALALAIPLTASADTLTATINASCSPQPATLVVPAGRTASAFVVSTLTPGTKCVVGGTPDAKGWSITRDGGRIYAWTQWQSNAPSEMGGPLASLALGPGTYQVWVDGGVGANATLQYAIR
jgi:hypothetical protein